MLLLVTILLVVVGTISLVIGFVQSSLLPIYISIACSVLAAVVLLIFSRMTAKSQQVVTADTGPSPLDLGAPAGRTQPQPAYAGTGLLAGKTDSEGFAPDGGQGDAGSRYGGFVDDEPDDDVVDDDFPIERYDTRRVGEILPLLAELDLDELDIVREHEEEGKGRATVLARIDQLIDQLEAEDRAEAASRFDTDATPAVDGRDDLDDVDDADGPPAPMAAPIATPPPTQAVSVAALPDDDGYFPIEDYDDLRASEILPLLPELDDDELEMVQARERSGSARSSILRRIEALLGTSTSAVVAAPAPAPEPEPEPAPDLEVAPVVAPEPAARKAPAKRAAASRKAPAKKAAAAEVPTRKAAPAPVKRAPAARKATPAKAAKAVTVATSASAAKAKRSAVTTAKVPPVKKAPVAKAVPAKRTTTKAASPSSTKTAKATRKAAKS